MLSMLFCATLCGFVFSSVWPLQMQCYHCEETLLENDCSAPQFIVNCTANIQNACQKEVIVGTNDNEGNFIMPSGDHSQGQPQAHMRPEKTGVSYRKACASFTTCLIVSAGYQSFCSPGRVGSVCISCCNTPLCNGPRPPRISRASSSLCPLRQILQLIVIGVGTPPLLL